MVTIVPSFEYKLPKGIPCDTFTGCVNSRIRFLLPRRYKDDLPKVKADVQPCIDKGRCRRFRESSKTHVASCSPLHRRVTTSTSG